MSAHLGDLGFIEFCLSIDFKCELDFLIPEAGLSKPWHCLWFYISSQFLNVANFYVCFIQLPPGQLWDSYTQPAGVALPKLTSGWPVQCDILDWMPACFKNAI